MAQRKMTAKRIEAARKIVATEAPFRLGIALSQLAHLEQVDLGMETPKIFVESHENAVAYFRTVRDQAVGDIERLAALEAAVDGESA